MGERRHSGEALRDLARRLDDAVETVDSCGADLPAEVDAGPLGPAVATAVNEVAAHAVPLLLMIEATADDLRRAAERYDEIEQVNEITAQIPVCEDAADLPWPRPLCSEAEVDPSDLDEVFNPTREPQR